MSTTLYEETKKQIQNADVSKELEGSAKKKLLKNVNKEWRKIQYERMKNMDLNMAGQGDMQKSDEAINNKKDIKSNCTAEK